MLNLKKQKTCIKKQNELGYITLIMVQFKSELNQCLMKPHAIQYHIKSKLY